MANDVDVLRDLIQGPDAKPMNEALASWAEDHEQDTASAVSDSEPDSRRSVRARSAPCRVCRQPGREVCVRCDQAACPGHFHVMYGLCDRCVRILAADEAPPGAASGQEDGSAETQGAPRVEGDSRGRPPFDLPIDWVDD